SGHKFNASLPFPCYGSVVAKERGYKNGLFPFVQLGRNIDRRFNGGIAGFLGDQFNPFEVTEDPNAVAFKVRDLSLASAADRTRLERRYAMLADLDHYDRKVEESAGPVQARDEFYAKAHGLITSPAAKKAFAVEAEPDRVREAYGRTPFGQSCLLARRLVEAGGAFVTGTHGGGGTHQDNLKDLNTRQPPRVGSGSRAPPQD